MATEILFGTVLSDKFWLPSGYTWGDLDSKDPNIYHPKFSDLPISILVALVLICVRLCWESFLIIPLGKYLGLKENRIIVDRNPALETAFKRNKHPDDKTKQALSKQTDLTIRQIEKWYFKKRKSQTMSVMKKFCECSWHLLFYQSIFFYGLYTLWDKSWFWDTRECWKHWPNFGLFMVIDDKIMNAVCTIWLQTALIVSSSLYTDIGLPNLTNVSNDCYWYYMLELGFYWSLVFTLLTDAKRKDFPEMIIHHISTIILISFSWVTMFYRIGTLVVLVHDVADSWMATAKMAKYANYSRTCEVCFTIFAVIWIVTRIFVFPYWVIYSTYVESLRFIPFFRSWYLFNGLLILLLILHCIWTYFILRMASQKIAFGELKKDSRSDSESEEDTPPFSDSDEDKKLDAMKNSKNSNCKPSNDCASPRNPHQKPGSQNNLH